MSPPSPNVHPDRDTTRVHNTASPAPSPYHELHLLDPDEDLIQLETPSLDSASLFSQKETHERHESNELAAMGGKGKGTRQYVLLVERRDTNDISY